MSNRDSILAQNLINYSTKVQKGEKVLIKLRGIDGMPLLKELIKETYKAKGFPFVWNTSDEIDKLLLQNGTKEQIKIMEKRDSDFINQMNVFIEIIASENLEDETEPREEKIELFKKYYELPIFYESIISKKKVVVQYPNLKMANDYKMELDDFKDFYYKSCNLDYEKLSKAIDKLVYVMNKTDKVKIKGNKTDLEFSIKGIKTFKCTGSEIVPDGIVFTAPVKNSVNGTIKYNAPSIYEDFTFENIELEFKNGKIINESGNNIEKLKEILDTDDGSRYVGKFAIGVNPFITKPLKDIFFDEKIAGSFNFAIGNCFVETDNGNESSVQLNLINIQTQEYGGEIYFDDVLIQKDGVFVLEELKVLNLENYL